MLKLRTSPMRLFKFIKFLAVFAFVLAMVSACRYCQKAGNGTIGPVPFVAEELKSEIPFSTKEPEIYQVEFVTTTTSGESKIFTARDGANRRFDYNFGEKDQLTFLKTDKNYLMFPGGKIFAENTAKDISSAESWTDFLTTEWLNSKTDVRFFNEGRENNLAKYRASFGDAENARSESLIFVDETVNLPVKQEFYSVAGEQKTLTMTIELKNLKLEAEASLFEIPRDFRKVSPEEFAAILKKRD